MAFHECREYHDVGGKVAKNGVVEFEFVEIKKLARHALLALGFNFFDVGEALRVTSFVDKLGVNWMLWDLGAALALDVVALARSVFLSIVAVVRLRSVSRLNLCEVFLPCLKMHGYGFETVH